MKNTDTNTLALFYAIPGFTILSILLMLFFTVNSESITTFELIKMIYATSENSAVFILLTLIMFAFITIAIVTIAGVINTFKRAVLSFVFIITISAISLVYIGALIPLITIPAFIYNYYYIKNMHNKTPKES